MYVLEVSQMTCLRERKKKLNRFDLYGVFSEWDEGNEWKYYCAKPQFQEPFESFF